MKEREMTTITRFVFTSVMAGIIWGCNQSGEQRPAQGEPVKKEAKTEENRITVSGTPLYVEIVQTDEERMRGLMFREKLAEDHGMLFVFSQAHIQAFWMRNTFIPLDIAFIDAEGRIIDIQRMEPLDESKSYLSPTPVPYVLEVNAGWFEQHGVKVGAMVKF